MDDKCPDVAVIALMMLQKFGCAITDSANVEEGSTLSLSISAVKVLSRVKFSKIFTILKRTSASKDCF